MVPSFTAIFASGRAMRPGLAIGLILLAVGGVLSLVSISRISSSTDGVERQRMILNQAQGLLISLRQIEAAGRGYLLSTNPVFAARLTEARTTLNRALKEMAELARGESAAKLTEVRQIETNLQSRAAYSQKLVAMAATNSAEALRLFQTQQGVRLSERIDGQITRFQEVEEGNLLRAQAEMKVDFWRSFGMTTATALAGLLLVAFSGALAMEENRRRRAAEAAALEQAEMARTTLSSIGDGVITTDMDGLVTEINPAAEALTGWGKAEAIGEPVEKVLRLLREDSHEPIESPAIRVLREGAIPDLVNHKILLRKDGKEIPVAESGAPIRDSSKRVRGTVLVFRDQLAQQAAEEERDRFFTLSLDVLCVANPDGWFKRVSQSVMDILGWSTAEMLERPFMDFVHPDDRKATEEAVRTLNSGQPVLKFENRYRCKDGSWKVFSWQAVPDPRSGLVYAAARDVTEARMAREELQRSKAAAEEANRAKSQFLANMSHELRTPLNAIIGFSEILEDCTFGELNAKQRRYVHNILSSGRHLLQLINDILDLAKIESGKLELFPETFSPARAIEDVFSIVKALAIQKSIALEGSFQPELGLIRADQSKFKQILFNLLSNAVKFTPEGGRVTVKAELRPEKQRIRISISDTGIGIKLEDQPRIWQEFEQVDSTYARSQQGTGLGLALTRKLVELHHGEIWLESEGLPGKGSTFTFELPVNIVPRQAIHPAQLAAPSIVRNGPSNPPRPLVLVVEDEETSVGLLETYLASGGYDMAHARSAAEALSMARDLRPFAITLDILLPDRPGWEVLVELKAHPETRDIPVVIVSITDDRQLGFTLGAVDFLVKPVDRERLLQIIHQAAAQIQKPVRSVLVVDDEPLSVEPIAEAVRAQGLQVRQVASGAEALNLTRQELPDLIIVDLLMPEMNGFELVERLRSDPTTKDLYILIHTSKDLSSAERTRLNGYVQGITSKSGPGELLQQLKRLGTASPPGERLAHHQGRRLAE